MNELVRELQQLFCGVLPAPSSDDGVSHCDIAPRLSLRDQVLLTIAAGVVVKFELISIAAITEGALTANLSWDENRRGRLTRLIARFLPDSLCSVSAESGADERAALRQVFVSAMAEAVMEKFALAGETDEAELPHCPVEVRSIRPWRTMTIYDDCGRVIATHEETGPPHDANPGEH